MQGQPALRLDLALLVDRRYWQLGNRDLSMREALGLIISHVKTVAEEALGTPVSGAVLTFPDWLDADNLAALKYGCRNLGGIPVMDSLSAASAALCASVPGDRSTANYSMVFDLGGQSFSVSLLKMEDDGLQVLHTEGNRRLGGADIDRLLAEHLLRELLAQGYDLAGNGNQSRIQILMQYAEAAKCRLSTEDEVRISAANIFSDNASIPVDLDFQVSRSLLEKMIDPLLSETIELSKRCLKKAGLKTAHIGEVTVTGGSAEIPLLKEKIESTFSCPTAAKPFNGAHVGAVGAALRAKVMWPSRTGPLPNPGLSQQSVKEEWWPLRGEMLEMQSDLQDLVHQAHKLRPCPSLKSYDSALAALNSAANRAFSERDLPGWHRAAANTLEVRGNLLTQLGYLNSRQVPAVPPATPEDALRSDREKARDRAKQIWGAMAAQLLEPIGALPAESHQSNSESATLNDAVDFSITTVAGMLPGQSYNLDVWAHLEKDEDRILGIARKEAPQGHDINKKSKRQVQIARGTALTVRVKIDGWSVCPNEDTIDWCGNAANAQFSIKVPADAPEGTREGLASVNVGGLRVLELSFTLQVGRREDTGIEAVSHRKKRYKSAFASYASADTNDVLGRIQGIKKVAPEMDIFFAEASLRSGDNWRECLEREILSRDVLYLFWSEAASKSIEVRREWEFALEKRTIDFIDPVPLVSPNVIKPPEELGGTKHFNDWVLAFMRPESE